MLNEVQLIGNVGANPEIRYTQDGYAIANLSLATTSKYKKDGVFVNNTEWHKCVCFGEIASIVEKYVKKGAKLYLEGKLKTRKWQDKEGRDHYSTEIIVGKMLMLSENEAKQEQEVQKDNFDYNDNVPF